MSSPGNRLSQTNQPFCNRPTLRAKCTAKLLSITLRFFDTLIMYERCLEKSFENEKEFATKEKLYFYLSCAYC